MAGFDVYIYRVVTEIEIKGDEIFVNYKKKDPRSSSRWKRDQHVNP